MFIFKIILTLPNSFSCRSLLGAASRALLEWQFKRVGSAPWLNSREQTSILKNYNFNNRGVQDLIAMEEGLEKWRFRVIRDNLLDYQGGVV